MGKSMLHVVRHPVVQHKLTLMREKGTSVTEFRANYPWIGPSQPPSP